MRRRSEFEHEILMHALRDRARREHAYSSKSVSPMFPAWTDGLFPDLRATACEYVESRQLRLHSHAAAVHSSMAFAFNLFLSFVTAGREALAGVMHGFLGFRPLVEAIEFEYVHSADILGEWAGESRHPNEPCTASDVGIIVRDEKDRRGIVLIEVKLSEPHFSQCNGKVSQANRRRDLCNSAGAFLATPDACYLSRPLRATKHRRYWEIFSREAGSVTAAFPGVATSEECPFASDNQQPMRNHALALGLVQAGYFSFSFFGLVHHDANPDILPLWRSYVELCRDPERLFSIPATTIVRAGEVIDDRWAAWGRYMRERYRLPQ